MQSLSLRGKFVLTLSVGALALAVMFAVSLLGLGAIEDSYLRLRGVDMVGRLAAVDIAKDINFFSRLTRNIMLGSNYEKDMQALDKTLDRIANNFGVLERLPFTPEEKALVAKAHEAATQFTRDGREIVAGLKDTPVEDRHLAYKEYERRATPFAMAFRQHYGNFETAMGKRFDTGMADMHERLLEHRRLLWIILGLAVAGIYALGYFVSNKDLLGMRACIDFAQELDSETLARRLDPSRMSSMSALASALNDTAASLAAFRADVARATREAEVERDEVRKALDEADEARAEAERARQDGMLQAAERLGDVVRVVAAASGELTARVGRSSGGAQLQERRVGETGIAMGQMNEAVLEVARNASQAAETSGGARRKAQHGAEVVSQVMAGIGQVQRQSLALKDDMTALGRQAEDIGRILTVISDIADQTNLLALNAAIEAARAGDAGRGFAVVADEVRKLAEKTMTATREVETAIRGIQQHTRTNVEEVDAAAATINETTGLARLSSEALAEIVALVDLTTDQIGAIAAASEQQSSSSEEINTAIEEVRRISGETSDSMRQAAQSVESLSAQAGALEKLIDDMRAGVAQVA